MKATFAIDGAPGAQDRTALGTDDVSDAELAAKPYFVLYLEPTSALSHPVESLDKLLFCADHGIPAIYSPAPLAGGTAPITIAGQVCQGTAESLLGLVILWLGIALLRITDAYPVVRVLAWLNIASGVLVEKPSVLTASM